MKRTILLLSLIFCAGCATSNIDSAISRYKKISNQINIGDSKEKVLSILEPTQKDLSGHCSKFPEAYMEENDLIEIYYIRSGRQPDGLTTDDEFTPYIFKNGKLVGIGWTMLGGPKSRGKIVPPPTYIHQEQKTIIH